MPATSLTVPSVTLAAGARTYGPLTVPTGLSAFKLALDQAAQPATESLTILAERSDDGGTTWVSPPIATATRPGGTDGEGNSTIYLQAAIGGDPNNVLRTVRFRSTNTKAFLTAGGSLAAS